VSSKSMHIAKGKAEECQRFVADSPWSIMQPLTQPSRSRSNELPTITRKEGLPTHFSGLQFSAFVFT
jgi:hypothetical protein